MCVLYVSVTFVVTCHSLLLINHQQSVIQRMHARGGILTQLVNVTWWWGGCARLALLLGASFASVCKVHLVLCKFLHLLVRLPCTEFCETYSILMSAQLTMHKWHCHSEVTCSKLLSPMCI